MALIELSIIPLGTGTTSLSRYIAQAVGVLEREEAIRYELTPFGTVIEGDLARVLSLIGKMHQAVFDTGVMRVVTTVKIDDRRDKVASLSSKVESVRRELKRLSQEE